jgi:hypothetical protein
MRFPILGVGLALIAAGSPALAQKAKPDAAPPAQIERLLACRAMTGDAERLACFDRETKAVSDALTRREIVAVDREKMRSTRRSLFGLSLPRLGLFDGDGEEEEIKQIEGVLAAVGRNRDGGFVFGLREGANWSQTDGKPIAVEPRRGDKVVVKRGVLGSYMLSVAGQPGVKVQRVN